MSADHGSKRISQRLVSAHGIRISTSPKIGHARFRAAWARVECMVRPAQGGSVGAAGRRVMFLLRPSRPSAAGSAARPRLQDAKSPKSPFCRRQGACPSRRAPDWCSPAGMRGLDGTGAKSAHARPEWHGCEVGALVLHEVVRQTVPHPAQKQRSGGMQKRTRPHFSCAARSFGPLLSCDDHNNTSRNSWPSTRCSLISASHCRVAAVQIAVIWLP
jgi:hypothetical protein